MSLRSRLIAVVIVTLAASLLFGGAATLVNASRSVRTEMRSALLVGRQTVDNVVRDIDTAHDAQRTLDELVASFKGNRHLRVWIAGRPGAPAVQPVDDRTPFGRVPHWFMRLIGVKSESQSVPVSIAGQPAGIVVIETVPRNEVLEVWDELSGSLLMLTLFAAGTIPLIHWLIGRALRPLDRLVGAMEQVGQGDYAIRLGDPLSPELARLRDSFNRMAARLAATDADNRRLQEQLLTLQEEERSDLARDLHDEVGPFLFAINVDIANMTRLLGEGRSDELPAYTQSITEAARHLQQLVRDMLARLRPIEPAECGLAEAVGRLVEFWRLRCPEIEFRAEIATQCADLSGRSVTTAYRIVQECLSNAVRHGNPRLITISMEHGDAAGQTIVEVADDGSGLGGEPSPGYGLIGMEERVRAIGGRLTLADRPGGGLTVNATIPDPEPIAPLCEAAR